MKKYALIVITILFAAFLTACNSCAESHEYQELPNYYAANYEDEVDSVNLQIQRVTDELRLETYHEFVEFADQPRIAITTDTPLRHFTFVELDFDFFESDNMRVIILDSVDELSPETPFVVTWQPLGMVPHRGIFFTERNEYAGNFARVFSISESEYDGTLMLTELDDRGPWIGSPRRTVTGVLENPTRAWNSIEVTSWFEEVDGQWHWREEGITHILSAVSAARVHELLSTMDAFEVLTPFHYERQGETTINIKINFADGGNEFIMESNTANFGFFRHTDTRGDHGDQGYVVGYSEELYELLMTYFRN